MNKPVPTLYLFNNIFYPQTVIPLTVTDQVSKEMLINCFQNNLEIAFFHPRTRSLGIGTLGKILLIDHNSDGSLNIVVQGLIRIKLLNQYQEDPFPLFFVEDYYDIDEKPQTLSDSPVERLYLILNQWLNRHVHSTRERERFMKDMSSPSKLINNLCMYLIKDIDLKLIFLESTSIVDRVRMMNALLIGESPEIEDFGMCEAIKNFERLEIDQYKNAS